MQITYTKDFLINNIAQNNYNFTINIMKFDEKVTKAVEAYAEAIIAAVKEHKFDIDIDLDYAQAFNEDNTVETRSALISTPIGTVVVFPNFKGKTAKAAIVNLGEMRRMEMEGFTEQFINDHGKIYGKLIPHTESNAEVFAYYLTHKIDPAISIKA